MCAARVENKLEIEGYTIRELNLRQMRQVQAADIQKEDFMYHVAAICVTDPDGKAMTVDDIDELPARLGTRLIQAVAELNVGSEGEEGNA
jgi:hypothetical protein